MLLPLAVPIAIGIEPLGKFKFNRDYALEKE